MSTTGNLVDIKELFITDTFDTWVNRTNQIIEDLNPLQVYDVNVGATGGLLKETGISAGNYNGVITVSVNPGPGIGTWTLGGATRTVVDFQLFDDYSLQLTGGASGAASSVASNDEFIVNDISDTTQSSSGTVKKVAARNMIPYKIDGDHEFGGSVIIDGSLSVLGTNTFIASNNLRIEDKQIELAYQQAIALTLTGVTGGTFRPTNFGATAYHFTTSSTLTADIYAHLQSYTGAAGGPTGEFVLGSLFQDPYDADNFVGVTGYISLSVTGNPRYLVSSAGTPYNSFMNDTLLSEGGIVLKGASGDKSLTWIYTDPDSGLLYNAWLSNSGIGVSGNFDPIIGRVFRSHGFSGNQDSIFLATPGNNNSIVMTEGPLGATNSNSFVGGWQLTRKANTDPEPHSLRVTYSDTNVYSSGSESFILYGSRTSAGGSTGAKWRAFEGITATNFAYELNVDQLDGAHGYTSSAPYSIPISNQYGVIDDSWYETSAIKRRVTQTSHGLTFGDVVRINATGNYVKAIASTPQYGEAIGIVSSVSGNSFVVNLKGKISGMSGPVQTVEGITFTSGEVYFLSSNSAGKLISDPDLAVLTKIPSGGVRKPMYLASSETEGYVLGYVGSVVPDPTDELYLDGLVPVGTIYPYSGSLAYLSEEWLYCDGKRYKESDYSALATILSDAPFINVSGVASSNEITILPDTRNFVVNDVIDLTYNGNTYSRTITAINTTTNVITLNSTLPDTATYTLKARQDGSGNTLFLIPDLRTRFIRGKGTTGNVSDIGGNDTTTLSISNLPAHSHGLSTTTTISGTNTTVVNGSGSSVQSGSTGSTEPFSNLPSYYTLHYIIRAKQSTKATILTGHDHDLRYIRYDGTHDSVLGLTDGGRAQFKKNAYVSGLAVGSSYNVYGLTHDHDLRYVRFDGSQSLSTTSQYQARLNINASVTGEGDGYISLGANQTIHNHDYIYPRFDTTPQASFDDTASYNFRNKIGVYGTADSDARFINAYGDSIYGDFYVADNKNFIVQDSSGTRKLWVDGSYNTWFNNNIAVRGNSILSGITSGDAVFYIDGVNRNVTVDLNNSSKYGKFVVGAYSNLNDRTSFTAKDILSVFKSQIGTNGNSRNEVVINGDFTVFPDGLTDGGDGTLSPVVDPFTSVATFLVDPHIGSVLIGGRQARKDGSVVAGPQINFVEGNDYVTPSTHGKITGLTFPTEGHHAANKDYVDSKALTYFDIAKNFGVAGYSVGNITSGLPNGTWMVTVRATVAYEGSVSDPSAAYDTNVVLNGVSQSLYIDNQPDGAAPINFVVPITVTNGNINLDSYLNLKRIQGFVGLKIG